MLAAVHDKLMEETSEAFLTFRTRNEAWPAKGESAQIKSRLISIIPIVLRENNVVTVLASDLLPMSISNSFSNPKLASGSHACISGSEM